METNQNLFHPFKDKIKEICPDLAPHRLKNTVGIMCALYIKQTVNLNVLKSQIGSVLGTPQTQVDSHYRGLQRYFNDSVNQELIWKILLLGLNQRIIADLRAKKEPIYLILDGTSWALGAKQYHLLTLSILYKGVSIPLYWQDLAKKGTSNFAERKKMLEEAAQLYDLKGMTLLADREYVGREWFSFLVHDLPMNFVIRLSKSDYKSDLQAQKIAYSSLLRFDKRTKVKQVTVNIEGMELVMVITKNPAACRASEEWVIVLTNLTQVRKQKILKIYRKRWQIESMFKHLKTNGFNLEDLGLTQAPKVHLMMSLVVGTYILAILMGLKNITQRKKRTDKNDSQKVYYYQSIFRLGLDKLAYISQNIARFLDFFLQHFKPVKPPQKTDVVQ
jgi:Transposase DDE domain